MNKKLKKYLNKNPLSAGIIIFIFIACLININQIFKFIGYILLILNPIILGFCISFILNIPLKFIENKIIVKMNVSNFIKRIIAIMILICLMIIFCIIFINIIIPNVVSTIEIINHDYPIYIENGNKFIQKLSSLLNIDIANNFKIPEITFDKIIEILKQVRVQNMITSMIGATTSIVGAIINFFVAFIFSIYVLVYKESLKNYAYLIGNTFLKKKTYTNIYNVYTVSVNTFSRFFIGQFLDACILGIICYVIMSLSNIPYASVICLTISITALIPIFGAFIGSIIGFILIVFISPIDSILFLAEFIVIQQIDNHFIYPNIVGKSIGLEGIFVIFAIIVGGGIAGPIGMLFFVPLISIFHQLLMKKLKKELNENPSV